MVLIVCVSSLQAACSNGGRVVAQPAGNITKESKTKMAQEVFIVPFELLIIVT
jgi:hypothetical protein